MDSDDTYPVWGLYDELRTMRLNIYYLEHQKLRYERFELFMEIVLAATTSSAIAGFWLWKTALGDEFWKTVGFIAAIISVVKPLLGLSKKAQETAALLAEARGIHHELQTITALVRQYEGYTPDLRERFVKALEYKGNYIRAYKQGSENIKLLHKCLERVNLELPADSFYVPTR